MNAAQLALLTTELQTDPEAWGYAALIAAGNDAGLADLLNGPGKAGDTLPPKPYTVQQLLEAVGQQGVPELMTAGLLPLLGLAGPTFDLGQATITTIISSLLTAGATGTGTAQKPACPHCLSVLPSLEAPTACTRAEKVLSQRGAFVTHLDIAEALGRGGTPLHAARLAALSVPVPFDMTNLPPEAEPFTVCHAFGLPTGIAYQGATVGELHGVYHDGAGHYTGQAVWYADAALPPSPVLDPEFTVLPGRTFEPGGVLCTALIVKAGD